MCDKAVDACLSALKFVPDWLGLSKIPEILDNVIFSNDDIDLDYIGSDIVTIFSDDMDINTVGINNINLDDIDLEIMIHVRLSAGIMNVNNIKHLKKC